MRLLGITWRDKVRNEDIKKNWFKETGRYNYRKKAQVAGTRLENGQL